MKLGRCWLKNFGSYKELNFDFENQGLALISGPTKSGKSTLMDAPAWILFGITSKDSAADDMKSWFADEPTEGTLEVYVTNMVITVTRIRGKANQNDLYWTEGSEPEINRGKDLKDTQRLLEERIGVTADLYLIGSYIHQFSAGDQFFIAKAKDRREVLEKLADLSLPIKLGERSSEARKTAKKELQTLIERRANLLGQRAANEKAHGAAVAAWERYETQRGQKVAELEFKAENFETERQKKVADLVTRLEVLDGMIVPPESIEKRREQFKKQLTAFSNLKKTLQENEKLIGQMETELRIMDAELDRLAALEDGSQCPTCLGVIGGSHLDTKVEELINKTTDLRSLINDKKGYVNRLKETLTKESDIAAAYDKCFEDKVKNEALIKEFNEVKTKIEAARHEKNHYKQTAEEVKAEPNPHQSQIDNAIKAIEDLQVSLDEADKEIQELEHLIASLNWLYDKSFELRACMLEQAKNQICDKTNEYLEKYFDAELRIRLSFEGADKLNVEISNGGYPCPFKQLSGGERRMLTLAFTLSLMKQAENVAGVKFGTIMLDEALNGLDASLKTNAYNLLQSLENEYETVLIIDHHEEFKGLFSRQYKVVNNNGVSTITNE